MSNRRAWDIANRKYVEEDRATLTLASSEDGTLAPIERTLLGAVRTTAPFVVHLQSGNGTDDFALARDGAAFVVGVDFSAVATWAAAGRAAQAHLPVSYVTAEATAVALADGCADLVYTGKGSLVWLEDLAAWAAEVFRLLRPGGTFFVYDAHPLAALWASDATTTGIDPSVDYFGGTRPNASFPASAIARFHEDASAPDAIERQWPLSAIVEALLRAGLVVRHLGEHAEPFWRPADGTSPAAAWSESLPNSFSILAVRPGGYSSPAV